MGIRPKQKKLIPNKAVFLDRDGTLIRHVDLMRRIADLKFFPSTAKVVQGLNQLGFLVVIITNQPVVARGLATPEEIDQIHAVLVDRLKKKNAKIDAVYFCPHHPNADIKKYRLKCRCRKPEPGLILKGLKKYKIDPKQSFMVGDAMIDVVSGKRAGLKTILVKTGPGHTRDAEFASIKPDFTARNLSQAYKIIKTHAL